MKSTFRNLIFVSLYVVLPIPSLWAQRSENGPALGVARLSIVKGDVTVQRGEAGDSIQAQANVPLVEGDILATGLASRAEIQLDYSNLLRLNEYSSVRLASLGDRSFRLQIERGTVTYSELRGGDADVDIETPLAAVHPEKNGRYTFEVTGLEEVVLTVRKGRAEVASANGRDQLKPGQRMTIRSADRGIDFHVALDDWDRWNERRDRQLAKSNVYHYVSRSIYGAEDLDEYGRWKYVPSYGRTWFPSVVAGWAPYRNGRWVWLDYYGWSWVSYAPWGWAPYHYGRWFHHARLGWGWHPGSYYPRHHWRPALVAFFAYGRHHGSRVGFGLNFGHYGWVPLAPGEPYYPWYGSRHGGYLYRTDQSGHRNTVLVDNSVTIYNNYRNARHHNGTTLVNAGDFSRGRIPNVRSLPVSELRRARVMRGRVPVVPDRSSQGQLVLGSSRSARGAPNQVRFFSTGRSRQSVTRNSFSRQRKEMANFVRSLGRADSQEGHPANVRSSTDPSVPRSAATSRTRTTNPASELNSSRRRRSRSSSSSSTRPGRSSVNPSLGGRFDSGRTATRSSGGGNPGSRQSRRRFNRRQSISRTPASRTPSGGVSSQTDEVRSGSSLPVRRSRSSAPASNSRINNRSRSSSLSPFVSVPRSSSRGSSGITTSPSRRSQTRGNGGTASRSRINRCERRDSRARPPAPRSRLKVRRSSSHRRSSSRVSPRSSARGASGASARGNPSTDSIDRSDAPRSSGRSKGRSRSGRR